ncbi:hypothetical protein E2C01_053432 [Portunus trituberculatus]|uniref:Uncharacterized protein n=1 Tax=Portunus trituberculatus TaxID=210409 RepID=A0A5B7GPB7_PORTR|nr:hypothetical protein [Portunus trituberculatus]
MVRTVKASRGCMDSSAPPLVIHLLARQILACLTSAPPRIPTIPFISHLLTATHQDPPSSCVLIPSGAHCHCRRYTCFPLPLPHNITQSLPSYLFLSSRAFLTTLHRHHTSAYPFPARDASSPSSS